MDYNKVYFLPLKNEEKIILIFENSVFSLVYFGPSHRDLKQ